MTDLPLPGHFDQAVELIDPEKITEGMPLGADPQKHIDGIKQFVDAGFDRVYIHQVGPNQNAFFDFYGDKVMPHLQ